MAACDHVRPAHPFDPAELVPVRLVLVVRDDARAVPFRQLDHEVVGVSAGRRLPHFLSVDQHLQPVRVVDVVAQRRVDHGDDIVARFASSCCTAMRFASDGLPSSVCSSHAMFEPSMIATGFSGSVDPGVEPGGGMVASGAAAVRRRVVVTRRVRVVAGFGLASTAGGGVAAAGRARERRGRGATSATGAGVTSGGGAAGRRGRDPVRSLAEVSAPVLAQRRQGWVWACRRGPSNRVCAVPDAECPLQAGLAKQAALPTRQALPSWRRVRRVRGNRAAGRGQSAAWALEAQRHRATNRHGALARAAPRCCRRARACRRRMRELAGCPTGRGAAGAVADG